MLWRVRVGVLGAAEARLDGETLDLGTRKQRAVLAALALHRGRVVPADTLVDLLWGEAPPAAVTTSLQGYVAGLRRVLEPDRAPRAEARVLVTRGGGYALEGSFGRKLRAHKVTSAHLDDYVENVVRSYLSQRKEQESFADWVARADEEPLRGESVVSPA